MPRKPPPAVDCSVRGMGAPMVDPADLDLDSPAFSAATAATSSGATVAATLAAADAPLKPAFDMLTILRSVGGFTLFSASSDVAIALESLLSSQLPLFKHLLLREYMLRILHFSLGVSALSAANTMYTLRVGATSSSVVHI